MKELYQETDKVSAFMDELTQEDESSKTELSKLWERCAAFANGNQNFMGNLAGNSQITQNNMIFSQYQDTRQQMFITNEIEPIVRTLVSYLTRAKPTVEVFPSDDSDDRKMKARVCERVMEAKYELDNESQNSKKAAHYALTFGTAFRKDYWDNTIGRDAEIPVYDELGNEVIDPATGNPQMQESKTGDSNVAILTPMSMCFDWSVPSFEEWQWVSEKYLMAVEWIKAAFDKNEPGYTGKASEVVEGGGIGNSLSVLEQMKYATPYTYGLGAKISTKGKALVQEMYISPNREFPMGRMLVKAGTQVVYDSALAPGGGSPYFFAARNVMWHPYTMFQYSPYVGRLLGKGLVESLIPQQMRLNEINGAIIFNANTLAKVDILAEENQLKRGVINGMGGNVYTFKSTPSGHVPTKWPGVPLPPQFFEEKKQLIEQMAREAGTNFVMQGNVPPGVHAAAAIEQLLENANTQQSDMMISWEKFHEQAFTKKARIIRNFAKLPQEDVVDYLRTMNRDNLDLEIKSFIGDDFGDGWMLKIESGSMIPKSEKSKRDMYSEFAKGGLLGPVQEDSPRGARLRKELLERFGETGFEIEDSADVDKADWENTRMMKGMPVEVWEEDNDPIHLSCHIEKMKNPKFLERASNQIKEAFFQHIQAHKQSAAQKQAGMPPKTEPPKVSLSISSKATPQDVAQIAGLAPPQTPMPVAQDAMPGAIPGKGPQGLPGVMQGPQQVQ